MNLGVIPGAVLGDAIPRRSGAAGAWCEAPLTVVAGVASEGWMKSQVIDFET